MDPTILFAFYKGAWHFNEDMSKKDTVEILNSTLSEIKSALQQGAAHVVFDLDSTLFDVTPRLQKILHNFADSPEFIKRFPESCALLKDAEARPQDWGIKDALFRAGLDGKHPEFQKAIQHFWTESFFSNEYLEYDVPYSGAVEFVKAVYNTGAEITYLTGRDIPRMQIGSQKVLRKWKFPMDGKNIHLVLKPNADMDDAQFKSDFFKDLPQSTPVWLFENEPVNVNFIRVSQPHVKMIFFHSVHAGKEKPPVDIPSILHYLME